MLVVVKGAIMDTKHEDLIIWTFDSRMIQAANALADVSVISEDFAKQNRRV